MCTLCSCLSCFYSCCVLNTLHLKYLYHACIDILTAKGLTVTRMSTQNWTITVWLLIKVVWPLVPGSSERLESGLQLPQVVSQGLTRPGVTRVFVCVSVFVDQSRTHVSRDCLCAPSKASFMHNQVHASWTGGADVTTANPLANDSGCLQLKACYLPLNFKGGLKGALPYFSVFCLIAADQIPPPIATEDTIIQGEAALSVRRAALSCYVHLFVWLLWSRSVFPFFLFLALFSSSLPWFPLPPLLFSSHLFTSLFSIVYFAPLFLHGTHQHRPFSFTPSSLPLLNRSLSSPPHQPSLEPSSPTFLSSFPHPG